jgi:glycosyltransferase involved in cell wall biosynthesis
MNRSSGEKQTRTARLSETSAITLSVVVPAYNEEDNIADTIQMIKSGIPGSPAGFEIIIVDDGSTDSTGDIVHGLALHDDSIKHVVHDTNRGKGASLISGFTFSQFFHAVLRNTPLSGAHG